MNGSRKYWIESKATFGDPYEIRRHLRKQLQPYSDLFGDGAVVYWFGHVDDQQYELPVGVDIVSPQFFDTPPVPFPYVPVGETPLEEAPLQPGAVGLREWPPKTFKVSRRIVAVAPEDEVVRVRMPRGKHGDLLGIADQLLR